MCFQITNIEKTPRQITKSKQVCYKVLEYTNSAKKQLQTPFYYMKIKMGTTYKGVLGNIRPSAFTSNMGTIEEGFHSYKSLACLLKDYARKSIKDFYDNVNYSVIVKCSIPKGAEYYINETQKCSNKIKYESIINASSNTGGQTKVLNTKS